MPDHIRKGWKPKLNTFSVQWNERNISAVEDDLAFLMRLQKTNEENMMTLKHTLMPVAGSAPRGDA